MARQRGEPQRPAAVSERDAAVLDRLIAEQERRFRDRQPVSARHHQRAVASLAGGVTSSWQLSLPDPIWISHGRGSRVWDVDGNVYVDYHGGYGVGLVGHAHPVIVDAVTRRVSLGTHFGQPCPDAPVVAEELASRFGLPLWRFSNSGTEATMNAVHLARSLTGRHRIVKFEGAYHGHHDSVRTSIWHGPATVRRTDGRRTRTRASSGIPVDMLMLTRVAPYNDLRAVEDLFDEHPGEIACVIVEPILMNCGLIPPQTGFLEGLRRLTKKHGALLVFDEVKSGLTIHPGGATRLFGIQPDIVCLAKALGGGLPIGAVGGTQEVMDEIVSGRYEQVGTMNGNPLSMAAARAVLLDILATDTYERLHAFGLRMATEAEAILRRHDLVATVVQAGPKGSISYCARPPQSYADFKLLDGRYAYAAWLVQYNGGVFLPPWSKGEQWLVSVQHTAEDIDRYLWTLEGFVRMLRG